MEQRIQARDLLHKRRDSILLGGEKMILFYLAMIAITTAAIKWMVSEDKPTERTYRYYKEKRLTHHPDGTVTED